MGEPADHVRPWRTRLGILTIGRKRPGFDQEWSSVTSAAALEALAGRRVDGRRRRPAGE